ncbi:DSS1/SEM1-like protein [Cynara cardunculus var. scolymus]|uniref:26S proteasome complex subunit SEM1 n=1 Tax=Cynara cardunculus var. scolymus TaxID=59895 RepID=A0A103XXX9_CYNCS|nr:DSS1/SEM1-like protein [Cynara cardunculus var. scolymus]
MATMEQPKAAAEEAKIDLFEDDDEFEEFEIDQAGLFDYSPCLFVKFLLLTPVSLETTADWDAKEEGKEVTQQWEDDWDDDDVNDDFSLQLRKELESNTDNK